MFEIGWNQREMVHIIGIKEIQLKKQNMKQDRLFLNGTRDMVHSMRYGSFNGKNGKIQKNGIYE